MTNVYFNEVGDVKGIKDAKNIIFLLIFLIFFLISFLTTRAQVDIYPKITDQSPEASTRPHWAELYPILGSASETFSVTYNETNMIKIILFWKLPKI